MFLHLFKRFVLFDKDDGGGSAKDDQEDPEKDPAKDEDEAPPKGKKKGKADSETEWTPAMQSELDKRAAGIKQRAKDEAKTEFEAAQAKIKEDAEKEALKDQGKWQELAATAEKEKADALALAEKHKAEAHDLRMQAAFEDAAQDLDYGFKDKTAAKDAFQFLDKELVGEDGKGMKKALAQLKESRPWLFDELESDESTNTDAKEKGQRQKQEVLAADRKAELTSRFRIRSPR